jgi:hypothetical protein
MGQNKLENQIREKLNTREIQPSSQAWDRLDAMLSVAEEKKTRQPFGFLSRNFGIAASVLVLLTVGMYFFTQKSSQIQPQNNVVETEVKKDTLIIKPDAKFQLPTIPEEEVLVLSDKNLPKNKHQSSTNNQEISIINQKQSTNQNQIIKDKEIEYVITEDVALKELPKIETRKEIVVQGYNNAKSDEALLASLEKVAKQSTNQKSVVKIDAKNLLSQVDGELELSFREKVIKKVSKNYKEVKVALANRNNE